ncbi:MAG: Rieske 2Fe-2S domain-containing protein [Steroidobacteraceae bacterium]
MTSMPHTNFVDVDRKRLRFRVDRRAYTDRVICERERDALFRRCWLYVGHGSEIAQVGDFVTRTIGGYDLIFTRDRAGRAHAFFNACTHRGATVCREPRGNARVLTCPYHGWVFDSQSGALRDQATKRGYPEGFNGDGSYDLRPVPRLDSYRDFFFVNYDANSISLIDYLAGAAEYLDLVADQSSIGMEVIAGGQELYTSGNWKLLVENSYDAYHGATLHRSYFEFLDTRVSGQNMVATQKGFGMGLGNGHGVFEIELVSGRPVAQWIPPFGEEAKPKIEAVKREIVERLGNERAERVTERQRNLIIFPNLVINDNIGLSVRTVYPQGPDKLMAYVWAMGTRDEDPLLRKIRLDNYLTFVGPGGFATPDDFEAFALCQRGNEFTPNSWSDISKGMTADEDLLHACGDFTDEAQMRGWWTQWDRMLAGAQLPHV